MFRSVVRHDARNYQFRCFIMQGGSSANSGGERGVQPVLFCYFLFVCLFHGATTVPLCQMCYTVYKLTLATNLTTGTNINTGNFPP